MTQPIRNILRDLDNIRENLLAFSDAVWLNIDHNDTEAMKAGIAFTEKFNPQLDAFGKLSDEMTRLVQKYTQVQTEGEASPETEIGKTAADNTRIIKDLNHSEPHTLTEDSTYMHPCGFVLDDKGMISSQSTGSSSPIFILRTRKNPPDIIDQAKKFNPSQRRAISLG